MSFFIAAFFLYGIRLSGTFVRKTGDKNLSVFFVVVDFVLSYVAETHNDA